MRICRPWFHLIIDRAHEAVRPLLRYMSCPVDVSKVDMNLVLVIGSLSRFDCTPKTLKQWQYRFNEPSFDLPLFIEAKESFEERLRRVIGITVDQEWLMQMAHEYLVKATSVAMRTLREACDAYVALPLQRDSDGKYRFTLPLVCKVTSAVPFNMLLLHRNHTSDCYQFLCLSHRCKDRFHSNVPLAALADHAAQAHDVESSITVSVHNVYLATADFIACWRPLSRNATIACEPSLTVLPPQHIASNTAQQKPMLANKSVKRATSVSSKRDKTLRVNEEQPAGKKRVLMKSKV